jgi:hypothetical protein
MDTKHGLCGLVVVGAMALVGCDKQPDPPKVGTNKPAVPTVEDIKAGAAKAAEKTKEVATDAAHAAKQAGANTADAISNSVNDAKSSEAARNAQATAADTMDKVKAQGSDLLAKLDAAIKENRLTDAQTYVDAFERIKANVPDELKTRYESLKASLKAAKDKAVEKTQELNK